MKRFILFSIVFLSTFLNPFCCLHAVRNTFGAGLVIGSPTGINIKHFLKKKDTAVEFDFSVTLGNIFLTANYLWHNFSAFPKVEEGELPLFYGISTAILEKKFILGGVFGVSYLFKEHPFDIFIKLSPVVVFERIPIPTFIGGIGGRYFFK